MGNDIALIARPGDPRSPCIAILGCFTSELTLVNLKGGSSSSVKISDNQSLGIVTIGGEVYVVTVKEILKIRSNGKKRVLQKLKNVDRFSMIVSFQKKIYIIQPKRGGSMLCFDPANNSFNDNLPACGLGFGFWASATDDFIYAMAGLDTEYLAKKFDPSGSTWFEIPPMNRARNKAAAVTLDGKIYVIGGSVDDTSAEYYNPGNNTWTEISNINEGLWNISACVIDNQLYVIAGDSRSKNRFYEHSIEGYSKDQWVMVTKFQVVGDYRLFACTWPHGSHHSDSTLRDRPEGVDEEHTELQAGHVSKKTEIKGQKGDQIELPGITITILEEDVGGDEEITVRARVHTKREAGFADIAPRIEFDPPLKFANPVFMKMKTCLSAPVGKKISVSLFIRDHPEDEWKEKEEMSLRERNEVEFEIQRCSGLKVAAKNLEGNFHLISDFYINSKTKQIVAAFTRDRTAHDIMQKDLHERNFCNFSVGPHEVVGKLGSEIYLTMECKKPKECTISDEVLPSASFTVNENFIVKSAHSVYYELEPEPTDECGGIKILYGCTLDGELDHSLPMTTEWPLTDIKTAFAAAFHIVGDNATVNVRDTAINVHAGDQINKPTGSE